MKPERNTSSGKVCAKHPELQGLRYVPNRICVECSKAHSRAVHAQRTMTVTQELTMLRSQLREVTAECELLRKDAGLYRFVSQLAWYVDKAAFVYDIGNNRSNWATERQSVDADEVESAISAAMSNEAQPNE